MNNTLVAKKRLDTTIKGWLVVGTLAIVSAGTLGVGSVQPAQAKGFIRRHPLLTAGAVVGGALIYRHHHKKKHRHHYSR